MSCLRIDFFILIYFAVCIFGCKDVDNAPTSGSGMLILKEDTVSGTFAYFDTKGIKKLGDYLMAFTDTMTDFAIVADPGFVLIDTNGKHIFDIFTYDNGPDYPSDGLYRIIKNGKIGYVDALTSKLIIETQYECAYPFENGKAKVSFKCETTKDDEHSSWKSKEWFYIDKKGKRID